MARGTKISRAVLHVLSGIPKRLVQLGQLYIRALYRAYTAFSAQLSRPHTLSLTITYPHPPRPFHDAQSKAHSYACRGRGPAFRFGDIRECRSTHAICGDGYGPLRRELYVGSCARGRYTASYWYMRRRRSQESAEVAYGRALPMGGRGGCRPGKAKSKPRRAWIKGMSVAYRGDAVHVRDRVPQHS
jgi:hypothetical protein